ncbi:hypothetical protein DPMN_148249 [Dreissena polymorpha]|uniref:Uncharacterized protein n=1 Tax=Dreissena polymorpha TaxID=45954 RepID=A0A9D4FDP2_DREPO|nr:hypothetical protein DPMN_148249 [Dreissena polymorpha]
MNLHLLLEQKSHFLKSGQQTLVMKNQSHYHCRLKQQVPEPQQTNVSKFLDKTSIKTIFEKFRHAIKDCETC